MPETIPYYLAAPETAAPPAIGDVAEGVLGPEIRQTFGQWMAAQARAREAAQARAASLTSTIGEATKAMEVPPPALPATRELPPPPSRGLRPFLAPVANETPETTIQRLIAGLGVLAAGVAGAAQGDVRGSLAALTGAMRGWHEGDKERADRAFADWQATTKTLLEKSNQEWREYEALMKRHDLSIEQRMNAVKLRALENQNQAVVEAMESGDLEKVLGVLQTRQKAEIEIGKALATLSLAKTNADLREREVIAKEQDLLRKQRLSLAQEGYLNLSSRVLGSVLGGAPGAPGVAPGAGTSAAMEPPEISAGPTGATIHLKPRSLGEQEKKALLVYDATLGAIRDLRAYSEKEMREYTGFANYYRQEAKRWMPGQADARYETFRALVRRLKQTAFGEGGKQLTEFEASVVFGFTPTGEEPSYEAFIAKVNELEKFTRARRALVVRYAAKGIDPATVPDAEWDQAMRGLGVSPSPGGGAILIGPDGARYDGSGVDPKALAPGWKLERR